MSASDLYIEEFADRLFTVNLRGDWTFDNATRISEALGAMSEPQDAAVEFRCGGLQSIDLTGAWLLYNKSQEFESRGYSAGFSGFKDAHFKFLKEVTARHAPAHTRDPAQRPNGPLQRPLIAIGRSAITTVADVGQMAAMVLDGVRRPSVLALRETINQLVETGCKAMPIVTLMSFMVGVVLAFQASTQLEQFGAGPFMIDLVAISILREMGVMLTAIMVAGRSGSAFAASLGVMKLNEETDALQVMGLRINSVLVAPRIIALVLALPILTAIADAAGIAGAWTLSIILLDLSTAQFMARIGEAVSLSTLLVGLSKAPVFALLIGAVSTLRGLQVLASAEELGRLTTRAVVESIFLIIAADAVFSVVYTELDI